MARDNLGNVWVWGANDAGQLGDGTTTPRPLPVVNPNLLHAVAIAAGGDGSASHSLAIACNEPLIDAHVLTGLTADSAILHKIVANEGTIPCPPLPAQPPGSTAPETSTTYGCPFKAVAGSGTYIKTALQVVFIPSSWDLYAPARGGRADAHKVLVILTDGENNALGLSQAAANANTVSYAEIVRRGADGTLNAPQPVPDDVEIFTIGFFDGTESAFEGPPPLCPANPTPAGPTTTDSMLIAVSNSGASDCSHYYPVAKTADLAAVFSAITQAILAP
jgi:hypothetical protein